ncbi:MAG: PQQ-binding-like beta-propeller repeat protein, partial [Dehalococcoidia bacterium]
SVPEWAHVLPDHKFFTRKRLIGAGITILLLVLVAWVNYPFLPNPIILIFNRPSTDLSSTSAAGQWSMNGGTLDQTRTIAPSGLPPAGEPGWSVDAGLPTQSAPIVADGVIYQGSHFKFMALEAATGDILWELPTTGPVHASAAVAGDLVYVSLINRRVWALDRRTGDLRWEFEAEDAIIASPVVANGIVYFGSWDGNLYARDAATGDKIWTYETAGRVSHHIALDGGVLVVTDDAGQMHTLNARTGQNRLVYRTTRSPSSASVATNDTVYFPSDGSIFAIDSRVKEIPWQFQFKAVWAQLWLWQVPGVPPPKGQQGGLWRFSPEGSDSSIISAPAISQGVFYVGDLQGSFYAQTAQTRDDIWRIQTPGRIYASPVVVGDRIYFGTDDGTLYALNRADGSILWQHSLGAPIKLPPAYAGDRIYLRTSDGDLHMVK